MYLTPLGRKEQETKEGKYNNLQVITQIQRAVLSKLCSTIYFTLML